MAFDRPHLGHTSDYQPVHYHQYFRTLKQYSDSKLTKSQSDYPSSTKKLHSSNNPKSNLVISVVEDDPKVLINILATLDKLFKTPLDGSLENLKDKDIYCVWATNTTDHNQRFSELTEKLTGNIDSVAILDGNSSKEQFPGSFSKETGHGVLEFLFDRKKQGLLRNIFAQFQSSQPDWVIDHAYEYEKRQSKLDEKIPDELKNVYKELELLHINPGYSRIYRNFEIKDQENDSLLIPSSFNKDREESLLKKFQHFFKTQPVADVFFTEGNLSGFHCWEQGCGTLGAEHSLFKMPENYQASSTGGYSPPLARNAFDQLKDRFKPAVQWMLENINSIMNVFDSNRSILVTNKLTGKIDTWMKSLLKVTNDLIDQQSSHSDT